VGASFSNHPLTGEIVTTTERAFDFQGLDHVALVVADMAETVEFYHHKLGMPVLHTLEYFDDNNEVTGQHWFFGVGDRTNPEAHLAMFWWKDGYQDLPAEATQPSAKPANPRATPVGSMLHLNLRVDADRIEEYCKRLNDFGIGFRHTVRYQHPNKPAAMRAVDHFNEYRAPGEGALMSSVYISDPSGNLIEFNAWLPGWEKWPNDAVALPNARA
jgi:catechol 2,3-dioxygenase-like lactoylglutathione lyase family enzyme